MMKVLRILAGYSPPLLVGISVLSVIDGASNAALLGVISSTVSGEKSWLPATPWMFLGLVLSVLVTGYLARVATLYLATRAGYDLRVGLCRQILALPLREFEGLGVGRALGVLTQDIPTITAALLRVPELLVSLAIVGGCLVYLGTLAPMVLLGLMAVMFVLFMTYKLSMGRADKLLERGREYWDRLLHQFNAVVYGFKELQLHAERRRSFVGEELVGAAAEVRRASFLGLHAYNLAKSWGKILFLLFIGFVLFGAGPVFGTSAGVLVAFVLTLLYMRDSVSKILDVAPRLAEARVAMKKIEAYGLRVGEDRRDLREIPGEWGGPPDPPELQGLSLHGVTHSYFHEGHDRDFTLGPIDLAVHPGEIVFVVGGNGSGKTTLAKVLTGLYPPESGAIYCNGNPVHDGNREEYRQLFAATFSDFHIFDRLMGLEGEGLDERARRYLERLRIDHKLEIQEGVFSTTELSRGQRKRLVLLTAYLEDRQVYLFDEWAADQDPEFKDFFYRELLPELRSRGKAVVVISHDDRYYGLGDRVVKLEDGKLVSDAAAGLQEPALGTTALGGRSA